MSCREGRERGRGGEKDRARKGTTLQKVECPLFFSARAGITDSTRGGSLIFIETIRDATPRRPGNPTISASEKDIVVHEVGHAVASSGAHPVTGGDSDPIGTFSQFTADYLAMLRSSQKPSS